MTKFVNFWILMFERQTPSKVIHGKMSDWVIIQVRDNDYPAYSMVICQVIDKLKLVLLFAVQYLTEWVKITIIFISYC